MHDEINIVGAPLNTERTRIERRYNRGYHLPPEVHKMFWKDFDKSTDKEDKDKESGGNV